MSGLLQNRYFSYCTSTEGKLRGVCPHENDSDCTAKHLFIMVFSRRDTGMFSMFSPTWGYIRGDARSYVRPTRNIEKFSESIANVYFDLLATDFEAMDLFIVRLQYKPCATLG